MLRRATSTNSNSNCNSNSNDKEKNKEDAVSRRAGRRLLPPSRRATPSLFSTNHAATKLKSTTTLCWIFAGIMALCVVADVLRLWSSDVTPTTTTTTTTTPKAADMSPAAGAAGTAGEDIISLDRNGTVHPEALLLSDRGPPRGDHPDLIQDDSPEERSASFPSKDADDGTTTSDAGAGAGAGAGADGVAVAVADVVADAMQDRGPLLEILQQAGMDDPAHELDVETLDSLPTWSKIKDLYGPDVRLLGLERCEHFRRSTDPRLKFIGVSGTFNTGTNLVSEMLTQNCQITERMMFNGNVSKGIRWQVPWGKHYPATERDSHVTRTDKDVPLDNTLPIVTIRDPYQWAQSMCRHPYAVRWKHSKVHCPNIVAPLTTTEDNPDVTLSSLSSSMTNETSSSYIPVDVLYGKAFQTNHESLFHFWNEWYQLYLSATFPRIIVRFEDLLFHGKEVTETICACGGGVERDDRAPGFVHISESAKLGVKAHGKKKTNLVGALIKYGTDEHRIDSMTVEDLKAARDILDPKLMELFGYQHPPLPE